jgi:hypothetical protein
MAICAHGTDMNAWSIVKPSFDAKGKASEQLLEVANKGLNVNSYSIKAILYLSGTLV